MKELERLIGDGQITARIDSQAKVLYARSVSNCMSQQADIILMDGHTHLEVVTKHARGGRQG
jgi:hypothetical protein